jgi:hypothetical protein
MDGQRNYYKLIINIYKLTNTNSMYTGVGIARLAQRRATGWAAGVRFPAETTNIYLLHCVQTGSGAHPVSYPMGTGGSFSGGKEAGA